MFKKNRHGVESASLSLLIFLVIIFFKKKNKINKAKASEEDTVLDTEHR